MESKIEKLIKSVDIKGVVENFVELKPSGKNFIGVCPFHKEDTPSFTVSPSKQIYHCFGCHKGGNVLKFLKDYYKVSFTEAIEILTKYSELKIKLDTVEGLIEYSELVINALGKIIKKSELN